MANETSIGVGLIGCGMIGQIHASALAQLAADGDVPIRPIAACDPSPEMAERAQANWAFPELHTDPAVVIDHPAVDAVVICTPTFAHRDLVLGTLAAGKHLYCEKPLAPFFPIVRELCDRVAASPVIAQVGFHMRTEPVFAHMKALVDSGELGAPMGFMLRDDQYFPSTEFEPGVSDWRSKREIAGGGALLEHSIHGIDILCWMFGAPRRISAMTRNVFGFDVEDTAALNIEFTGGVIGTLVTTFHGVTGREERRLEVFFERGVAEMTADFIVGAEEDSFRVQRPGLPAERLDMDALRESYFDALGVSSRAFLFYQYLAHRAFFASIVAGTPASPSFADALVAHATVDAAYRSADTGTPVAVEVP